ncbi:MAG: inositol-3-phosphate synthase [Desulfosarcinaceae bacterium]|nr:inositol-3-phosphate synthase [Desulfosarcinaceae bacterium]
MTTSRRRPEGRLGVLMPGMGAVATTFIGGVLAIRQGLGLPIGALSQMGTLPMAAEAGGEIPIKNLLPLARLEDLVFGGWDIFPENMHTAALKAGVLAPATLAHIKADLERIRPMPAVFDRACVRQIEGPHVKQAGSKMALAEQLRDDIRSFKAANDLDRAVMVWCASTESYGELAPVHQSLSAFEEGLETSHPAIVPSMIYAYAAIREGVPFANGAPNLTEEIPALQDLAAEAGVPISGKDFKSGQTMIKTVLAPAFKARLLGVSGWFSTNILGNRDGLVLRDAEALKSKQVSKLSALEQILDAQVYPDLYSDMYHTVDINYYPPRGDNKEGWDNIDIFGWLGYPMQIKIDFLCRDSILAAPLVLDVALFMDLAARCGLTGLQDWLAFYYKRPILAAGARAEHDLFRQLAILQDRLRTLADLAVPARGVSGEMAVN